MRNWKKFALLLVRRVLPVFVLAFVLLDLYCETRGLPESVAKLLFRIPDHYSVLLKGKELKCGVLHGLRLEEPRCWVDTPVGPLLVAATEVVVRPRLYALLSSRSLEFHRVRAAKMRVFLFQGDGSVQFSTVVDSLDYLTDNLNSANLNAQLRFIGIDLQVNLSLPDVRQTIAFLQEQLAREPLTPEQIQELKAGMTRVSRTLAKCDFGRGDAKTSLNFVFHPASVPALKARGEFSVEDTLLMGVMISKLRGKVQFDGHNLEFRDLLWLVGRNESLGGSLTYDLSSNLVSGSLNGHVLPGTALQLAGANGTGLDFLRNISTPLEIKAVLPLAPPNMTSLAPQVECLLPQCIVDGVRLYGGNLRLGLRQGSLQVQEALLRLNRLGTEYVRATADWQPNAARVAAHLEGCVHPVRLAVEMGVLEAAILMESIPQPISFQADLAESPYDIRQWRIESTWSLPLLRFQEWTISNMTTKLGLDCGRLQLNEGHFSLNSQNGKEGRFFASFDFGSLFQKEEYSTASQISVAELFRRLGNNPLVIDCGLEIVAQEQGRQVEGLAWQGNITRREGRFSLDGQGRIFLDRCYSSYCGRHFPGGNILARFRHDGKPLVFSLAIPDLSFAEEEWRITGTASVEDLDFDTTHIRQGSCRYDIGPAGLDISDVQFLTREGDKGRLDISVKYHPFVFTIKDISYQGDPEHISAFVIDWEAMDIYRQIWTDIRWQDMPTLHISSLAYRSDTSNWSFDLDGTITASKATYRTLQGENLSLQLSIRLPRQLVIKPISAMVNGVAFSGECTLAFDGTPQCLFQISKGDGVLETQQFLSAFNPAWEKYSDRIVLGENSRLTCNGSFYLSGSPELRLEGRMSAPNCKIQEWEMHDLEENWSLVESKLWWNVTNSTVFAGQVTSTGEFDMGSGKGDLLIIGKKLSWEQISQAITPVERLRAVQQKDNAGKDRNKRSAAPLVLKPIPGYVNFECRLNLLQNWAGRPLHLDGDGRLALREADLWQVPMLKPLGWLLGSAGTGKITRVDAELRFLGNHLYIPSILTDGTIIALSGRGDYSWENDYVNFAISGEALKNITLLNYLFAPLTWAFNAELVGPRKTAEWELRSSLRKWIPGFN